MNSETSCRLDDWAVPALLPLSVAQTDIWRAQSLAPDSTLYNIGGYVEIHGSIDRGAFAGAVREALSEIEAPHLTFIDTPDGPRQVIGSFAAAPIPFIDVSRADDPRAAAMAWMQADMDRTFDLASGPLFRHALIKIADDSTCCYAGMHHLIGDPYGVALILRRVADLYSTRMDGMDRPAEEPTSWREFLQDESRYGLSARRERDQRYWLERLRDHPDAVTLSGRPPQWPHAVIESVGTIAHPVVADLEKLGAVHDASLVAVITAVTAAYLSRMTGARDLILGMPVAARTSAKLRRVAGVLSNVVPVRLEVDPDLPFAELLRQAGLRVREAFRHQRYWTGTLRRDLGLAANQLNIYGTVLNFVPSDAGCAFAGQPARMTMFVHSRRVEDLAITVHARNDDSDTAVQFSAHRASYDAAALDQHRRRFLRLLECVAANAALPIRLLPILSAAERHRVLVEWNPPAMAPPQETFAELVEAQVARTPHALAVVSGERSLTYAELNQAANALAHRLIDQGVAPESLVGLCAERSLETVIGLMAIMKAGGAYLPLDPAYPTARLRAMLEDARPLFVLHGAATEEFWGARGDPMSALPAAIRRLSFDARMSAARDSDANHPNPDNATRRSALSATHPAYVIYTSGSSGTPKGVVVTHSGIGALAAAQSDRLGVTARSRVLQFSSLNFDASVWEIVMALTSGAALVLTPPDALSGAALRAVLVSQRISHVTLPPAVLATLESGADLRLECLVVAGEVCPPRLIAEWSDKLRMINAYGPTESTVCATMSGPLDGLGAAPIGTPIPGTRVYVLDGALEPAAIGVAGELYIAGIGLARGYLNRPGLTAERFVADPYGIPGSRMYRSGDLARWRQDGVLEYLGRADQQVKLRGLRIELGEIEAALLAQDGILDAAVIVRDDEAGGPFLAAYLVTSGGGVSDQHAALRAALAQRLPEQMIPRSFVSLAALPLGPNGKLDRRMLAARRTEHRLTADYQPPQGAVETALAVTWAEILKIARIGRHDDFFELGANSLLIVDLIERLRRRGLTVDARAVFSHPCVAALAAVIGAGRTAVEIPPNRIPADCKLITPDLLPLVVLDQAAIDRVVAGVSGGTRNVQDIYPLGPLQQGMLVQSLMSNDSDAHVLRTLLAFQSRERVDQFLAALQTVVNRHDVLRSAMHWEGLPEPLQIVWRNAALPVETQTFEGESVAEGLWGGRHVRVDLNRAPAMRVVLAVDAAHSRWLMLLQSHHLLIDHTTLDLILDEVRTHLLGGADQLEPPVPFRNFVAESRMGIGIAEHEAFFRRMLGDLDEPTAPFGMLDVRGDGALLEEARQALDAGLAQQLRGQVGRLGVTASSLFHLAWALVLARTSAREDVVFGTVLFGRMHGAAGVDRAFGLFINTLPLRLRLDATPVEEAVRQTHARLGQLLHHEHASLALAQRCSAIPGGTPLFSALLNYRYDVNGVSAAVETELLPGVMLLRAEERSNYPLSIAVDDFGSGFNMTAQTSAAIDPARICRFMHTALEQLVQALIEAPQSSVRSLQVLSPAERHQVVYGWNATEAAFPAGSCIHEFIEAQAARTPHAPAVLSGEGTLSYAELNRQANRLAHHLIALGLRPDDRVAIALPHSPDMLVAVLATLKAGAAYVPLDPGSPAGRLAFMIADCAPRVLLTRQSILPRLPGLPATLSVLSLDGGTPAWAGLPDVNPAALDLGLKRTNLAYVIYTSGSTGSPKGVLVEHGNLIHSTVARFRYYSAPAHRFLLLSSLSFDSSAAGIFWTLSQGGALVLPSGDGLFDPLSLGRLIQRHGVTHLLCVPSLYRSLLDEVPAETFASLQAVIVAGEECPPALVEHHAAKLGLTPLYNEYGPTECCVWSTVHRCSSRDGRVVPIGRPIANSRVYLLDDEGGPVPVGVAGEICIGGAGVVRGYLRRPELTAERFLPDPFAAAAEQPGSRLYRTGDRGRFMPDGQIEFLGRVDQQVKIRGFRVELGEVEASLRALAGIHQAAVIAREAPGGRHLAAYLVGEDGVLDPEQLRLALTRRLPEHMIPAAFVRLPALPLTPNGKLDRRALAALPAGTGAAADAPPPNTPTEIRLAGIWRTILRLEKIGRSDDFFALGGHSLLALQVVSRVRDVFGLELPLKTLFDVRTLKALATDIDSSLAAREHTVRAPMIVPGSHGGPVPLSYSQERMWLIQSLNPNTTAYNMVSAIRIRGPLDLAALSDSFDDLNRRHEILRSSIRMVNDQPMQQVEPWTRTSLAVLDLRAEPEAESRLRELAEREAQQPFDLRKDAVIRVRLFRTACDLHVLLMVLHHIAGDQWSMGVLGRELTTLYNRRRRGVTEALEPLPVTYRDYAVWQRSGVFAAEFTRQLAFWRRRLDNLPALDLPTDRPRPRIWTLNGAHYDRPIPPQLIQKLQHLGRGAGSTLFMTLFAGFAALLHRITGQEDIPIGVPVANRTHSELEALVGTFVNTVVLRIDLSGNPDFNELLQRVRATALEAFAHQDLSFDRLVQEIGQRGDRSRAPLAQVLFNVASAPMHDLEFDGLVWEPVELDRGGAQFELSLSVDSTITRKVSVEYNTDLFDATTIERLVGQYFTSLEAMVDAPRMRVGTLPMLRAEQHATLLEWNSTRSSHPQPSVFAQLFASQAASSPQAPAVSFEGATLTYAELNARSNAVARLLRDLGVGPGVLVAICAHRSPLLLVGLLAIQKSGGAYVPLDPEFPPDRLQYMLSDSGAAVMLTTGAVPTGLDVPAAVAILDLTAAAPDTAPLTASEDVDGGAGPRDTAYVMYTSGSTGRPKGVAVPHGALLNFLCSMRHRPGLAATDVLAAVTTISFDIAGLELYLPLLVGARIELVSRQTAGDGRALAQLLTSSGATVMQATPATWRLLLEADWTGGEEFRAFCGGEPLPKHLADATLNRVKELWNLYGPTETTIWSTVDRVERGPAPISIGRPIANTQVHILDAAGQLAPIGAVGEIYIGGAGVAAGYHQQPALTAERFVPDPYSDVPGARLYRTGDLGRWDADGKLYHLGRSDHQVKIRGFRIELGEVETVLGAHPAVREAAVVVREAQLDDPRLTAFVAYHDGEELTAGDMRKYLRRRLPEYMIPSIVVPVAALPLTPNGKVDRAALPDPYSKSPQSITGDDPPAPGTEQVIAEIWRAVLKIDRIGAGDNFFELGGYSLLSLRVAQMVEKRTGLVMDPRTLFFHSLRQVAALVEHRAAAGAMSEQ